MEKIIKVYVSTNTIRNREVNISNSCTVKDVLQRAGAKADRAQVMLDGMVLTATELNSPLSTFTNADECSVSALAKMDNAA